MQGRQRNVQNSVMHVQSCYFAHVDVPVAVAIIVSWGPNFPTCRSGACLKLLACEKHRTPLHGKTGRFTVSGEWYAKSRTGKFRSGIVLTIFTNQFLSPKNDRESLELVSKMGFNKWWYSNFCLEYSIRKNRTTLQMFRCSRKFSAATQKGVLRLLSNRVFGLTTSIFRFFDPILARSCKSHKLSREAKWPDRAVAGRLGRVHL